MKSRVTAVLTRSYYASEEFEGDTAEEISENAQQYFEDYEFVYKGLVEEEDLEIIDIEVIE